MNKDIEGDLGHTIGLLLDAITDLNAYRMALAGSRYTPTLEDIHLRPAHRKATSAAYNMETVLERLRQERSNKETAP